MDTNRQLDRIEQATVLECLREIRNRIGLGTADTLVDKLAPECPDVTETALLACVNGKYVGHKIREQIAPAALRIIADNSDKVMSYYGVRNLQTQAYLSQIIFTHTGKNAGHHGGADDENGIEEPSDYAGAIFANFRKTFRKGNGILKTGIYQIYRRYKPITDDKSKSTAADELSDRKNQIVICELIYVNSDDMTCIVITSELKLYFGTLSINHENILHGIMQRQTRGGINHRFMAMKLEGVQLPMYSGICIKTGEMTHRPLASDCLYIRVPPSKHPDLYKDFEKIRGTDGPSREGYDARSSSAIPQYVTDNPPVGPYDASDPAWSRVRFIQDFPKLAELIVPDRDGLVMFHEPLRTISRDALLRIAQNLVLPVFRHDKTSPRGNSSHEAA